MDNKQDNTEEQFQSLTPEQKKNIWEWIKYLGRSLIVAILKKLSGNV